MVRSVGGSPAGGPVQQFFLVSDGMLQVNGTTYAAGHFTSYGDAALFSSANLHPGPVSLFCYAKDDIGQIVSSSSVIMITAKPKAAPPTVSCTGPTSVNTGDTAQITATATSADPNLQYSFTTSAGTLNVSGNNATLVTNGLSATKVNVSCNVIDSSAQTASATTSVYVSGSAGEQALTAFQFVDSVGVNTHLHFGGTPYFYAFDQVFASMQALGIRHYRNGIDPYAGPLEYQRAEALGLAGIKADWLIDIKDKPDDINAIYQKAPDSIGAMEGPNEDNDDAGPRLTNFMQMLSSTVRGNPNTATVPIYAPTVSSLDALVRMGDLSAYADYGNMHDYYSPRYPEVPAYGGSFFNCGYYGTLSFNYCLAQLTVPNKPVVTTETGYMSSTISDAAIARYTPRLLFKHLQEGVPRTYLYELVDETSTPAFGLVRNDFTPKPVYNALQNLIRLFQDNPSNSPGKLDYSITGNTDNLQRVLFQKSDGTFLLAVWLGVPSADGQQTFYPAPQPITITTSAPTGTATIYTLDDYGNMSSAAGNTSSSGTSLAVTDRITVVALPPR